MDKETLRRYLYYSYLEARRHKVNSQSHQDFAKDLEKNLDKLCDDIFYWNYEISPSIYFIQRDPVQREVFAGNFRDRIVHHLIFDIISPYREKQFIYDSYSCRKWKWTSFGIKRISKFMRSCSDNYQNEWRILKLDIQWYFMSINRDLLRNKVYEKLKNRENLPWIKPKNPFYILTPISDKIPEYLIKVVHDIIYNDPTENWIFRWKRSDYIWLPKTKSLFWANENCWLPIWNLTSQLFSNIYLNDFDHFVKEELKIKYYGRYVDDFVLIHNDKNYLLSLIPIIHDYLKENEKLTLHPKKIYIQPISHGVQFLGAIIKPYCIYRSKRTIWNIYRTLRDTDFHPCRESLDSYIWLLMHFKQYRLIQKILGKLDLTDKDNISEFALSFLDEKDFQEVVRKRRDLGMNF
mgnify:CR=1 FL=1